MLVHGAENKALIALKGVRTTLALLAIPCFLCVPILLYTSMNWFWGTLECCYSIFNYLLGERLLDRDKLKLLEGGKFAEDPFGLAQVAIGEPLRLGLDVGLTAALCALLMAIALCIVAWRITRAIRCVDGTLATTLLDSEAVPRVKRSRIALVCLAAACVIFVATSFIRMWSSAGAYYDHAVHPIQYLEQRDLLDQEEFAKFEGGSYKDDHLALEISLCPVPANFVRVCSAQRAVAGSGLAIVLSFLVWRMSRALRLGIDALPS